MSWSDDFRSHVVDIMIELLLKSLSPALITQLADSLLDIVEKAIEDSDSTLDDRIGGAICSLIRRCFRIEDV